jgi:hypothetical protein
MARRLFELLLVLRDAGDLGGVDRDAVASRSTGSRV